MSVLALKRATVSIAGLTVCRDLDLELRPGEVVGMLGPNGVGKTTLLHTLAGLRDADAGAVTLDGRPLVELRRREIACRIGLLMQHSNDPFPASVLETALIGRHPHLGPFDLEGPEDLRLAQDALASLDLAAAGERDVHRLSGGERRRLAIATVLTQDPDVYLMDEPLDQLDLRHQLSVLALCRELAQRGAAVLLSMHDPEAAYRHCDRVVLLHGEGEVCIGAPEETLTDSALSALFATRVRRLESAGEVFFRAG